MENLGPFTSLVIDDGVELFNTIRDTVGELSLRIVRSDNADDALAILRQSRPRVVFLNLEMRGLDGMLLAERVLAADPGVDLILISAYYSAEDALDAIKKGACDCMTKPLDPGRLRRRMEALLADAEERRKSLRLDQAQLQVYSFEGIVGRSPLMLDVFAKIRRVAPHFRTVLVRGATGTGKELIAQALHRLSPAGGAKFVVCNCSALVETLMESELFGHVRGAFTGAVQDRPGLFEVADGGTVFLDEIGELSPAAQAKLLRVLQNRQVQRVGSVAPRNVNVRVVAATHRDLKAMVREGLFREDLYYRLAVTEIHLPNLASRREDIPLLARYFLKKYAAEYRKPASAITRRAQLKMASYSWPGNVRELENVIARACMEGEDMLIDLNDLPERLCEPFTEEDETENSLLSLEEVERRHVLRVLEGVGGNKAKAAEVLGIGRATIYQLLSKIKVEENARGKGA